MLSCYAGTMLNVVHSHSPDIPHARPHVAGMRWNGAKPMWRNPALGHGRQAHLCGAA